MCGGGPGVTSLFEPNKLLNNSKQYLSSCYLSYSDVLKNKGMKLKSMDGAALSDNLRQHLPTGDPLFKVRGVQFYFEMLETRMSA